MTPGFWLVAVLTPYGPLAVYGVVGGGLVVLAAVFAGLVVLLSRGVTLPGSRLGTGSAIGAAALGICTVVAWLTR